MRFLRKPCHLSPHSSHPKGDMKISPELSGLADVQLLELCERQRDTNAFAALVDRYKNLLCSVAYGIVGDVGRSEDVAQEAFLVAWEKSGELRDRSKLRPWLCGIARNLALAVVRKRTESGGPVPEAVDEESPDRIASADEERELVWRTLAELPETYREPLVLYYREGESVAKVAEGLGLSEAAVKQRLSRGRSMLRDSLADLVGSTLTATRPGPAFVLAVVGALPGVLAGSAAAATAGAGAAGKAAAGGAALSAGAGALLGTIGGLAGGWLGCWAAGQTARYSEQRTVIRRYAIAITLLCLVFAVPFVALGLGWWSVDQIGTANYLVCWLVWMLLFGGGVAFLSWRMGRAVRAVAAKQERAGGEELAPTSLRRFLGRWEGRRWSSRARFLGWPVIDVAFGSPDRDFTGYAHGGRNPQETARGWIAFGDKAIGLLAVGNIARGGIALGGVAIGVFALGGVAIGAVSFGGLAVGLLCFGGAAVGLGAIGGGAAGWWAFGGAAAAWKAAMGGAAFARDFAVGGAAFARNANDEAAKAFIEGHPFFVAGEVYLDAVQHPAFLPLLIVISLLPAALFWTVGVKRIDSSGGSAE